MSYYHIEEASLSDSSDIVAVTNDAFMADAFFKKPEYHLRFDLPTVQQMIQSPDSVFLVAKHNETNEILGSMFLHWDIGNNEVNYVNHLHYYRHDRI